VSGIYESTFGITVSVGDTEFKEQCGGEQWNNGACSHNPMNNLNPFQAWSGGRTKPSIAFYNYFTGCT
jgi:hypothetical protein